MAQATARRRRWVPRQCQNGPGRVRHACEGGEEEAVERGAALPVTGGVIVYEGHYAVIEDHEAPKRKVGAMHPWARVDVFNGGLECGGGLVEKGDHLVEVH